MRRRKSIRITASVALAALLLPGAAPATPPTPDIPKFGEYTYVDELPEAVTRVAPEYPAEAQLAAITGTVMIQVLVGTDGRVKDTKIIRSIPPLDAAAQAAARQWVFKPALAHGKPVAVWVAVPMKFPAPLTPVVLANPPSAPTPRDPARPEPGDYVRVDVPPEAITRVEPEYPELARQAQVEGTVLVMALVNTSGVVRDVRVRKSVPMLDQAAVDAMRQWTFKPATASNVPVAAWVTVLFEFGREHPRQSSSSGRPRAR